MVQLLPLKVYPFILTSSDRAKGLVRIQRKGPVQTLYINGGSAPIQIVISDSGIDGLQ